MPQLKEKFDGVGVRGPVPSGSLADMVFVTDRPTSVEEITRSSKKKPRPPAIKASWDMPTDPIVSSDIIMDSQASIVDLEMTQVVDGDLVKILSWYDNEWGYTNQMVREVVRLSK